MIQIQLSRQEIADLRRGITLANSIDLEGTTYPLRISAASPEFDGKTCCHCGSTKIILRYKNSHTFAPRRGCAACGRWLEPQILKD